MSFLNKALAVSTLCLLSLQAFAHSPSLTLQDTKQLSLNASQLKMLRIEAAAGELRVSGTNSDSVSVRAEIYQAKAHQDYVLTLSNEQDIAVLKANTEWQAGKHNGPETAINLVVEVPKNLALEIHDGSGGIVVEQVANTQIHDGSGAIKVNDITGDLAIHDGSGSIDVENVSGNVTLNDGSGPILIKAVTGDLDITDGSSSIDVVNVGGTVTVSDGSGDINIADVNTFKLRSDGSGKVKLKNVNQVQ